MAEEKIALPPCRFTVFSDPHYIGQSLYTEEDLLVRSLDADKKFLLQGQEVVRHAVKQMAGEESDFVLISGDCTKDGEKESHNAFATLLGEFRKAGKKVLVIPGNHDIQNGRALRFIKNNPEPAETVTAEEFKDIYRNFGYGDALTCDEFSLSYVAEPVEGLWIFALDSNRWRENKKGRHSVTGGRYYPETLRWIEEMLMRAKMEGKAVMVMQHHALLEHFPDQKKYFSQFIIQDSEKLRRLFMAYGVEVVYTGHYHAQDIAMYEDHQGRRIYDIETGSFVTYPLPYRRIEITSQNTLRVETHLMKEPDFGHDNLTEYVYTRYMNIMEEMAAATLKKFLVSKRGIALLSRQIAESYLAHLAGDEKMPENFLTTAGIGVMGKIVLWLKKDLLLGWFTQSGPDDNNVELPLR